MDEWIAKQWLLRIDRRSSLSMAHLSSVQPRRLQGQAQEIDGYILINDMPEDLQPEVGKIYNVEITDALEYDLVGRITTV